MHRRLTTALAASALALITVAGSATATAADAAPADEAQVLASWTQTGASSYSLWTAARANQTACDSTAWTYCQAVKAFG
jgi:hypothetical protein